MPSYNSARGREELSILKNRKVVRENSTYSIFRCLEISRTERNRRI